MVYTKDIFLQHFKDCQYTAYECYEGIISSAKIESAIPLEIRLNKDYTNEICLDMLDRLFSRIQNGAKLTFVCRNSWNSPRVTMMQVNTSELVVIQNSESSNQTLNGISEEDLTVLVESRLQAILIEREQKREMEEQKAELERMKTHGGKLAFILQQTLAGFMPNMANPSNVMQGFEDEPTAEPQQQETNFTKQQLDDALIIIVNKIGVNDIIKLAIKIESGEADGVLPMLKQFINN